MQRCPNCNEKTITNYSKAMLGPGRTISCSNCNSKISISWWSWIAFVLIFGYAFIMRSILDPAIHFTLTMVLLGVYLYIHMRFIPLVVRNKDGV